MIRTNANRKGKMRYAIIAAALAPCFDSRGATPVIDQYTSTGDNLYIGTFLPEDSPASINASFDLMKDLYGTRRIYWRGLQESSYIDTPSRPENVIINKVIENSRDLINNQNLNAYAAQAAHARGMQFWGATQLFDWGVPA